MLQIDIISICDWIFHNELSLNFLKCCYIIFSRRQHPSQPPSELYVMDRNGQSGSLTKVNNFNYLGVILSHNLTWSQHIENICNKMRRLVGMLYRNFYRYVNRSTLLMMYKSIIRPHMEYACTVWDPRLAKDIKPIENMQKFALRVCNKTWDTSCEALLTASSLITMAHWTVSLESLCVV